MKNKLPHDHVENILVKHTNKYFIIITIMGAFFLCILGIKLFSNKYFPQKCNIGTIQET